MNENLEVVGKVVKVFGNNNYLVAAEIEGQPVEIPCYLAGKMVQHKIKVIAGDTVHIIVPPPFTKGRIAFREK